MRPPGQPEGVTWVDVGARAWDVDVVLADGATVRIRSIDPGDVERLQRFHAGLSPETIYSRFFGNRTKMAVSELRHFCEVDGADRTALVGVDGDGTIVAVGRYDRTAGAEDAEVALTVGDAFQGRGLGTILLEHLAAYARTHGIRRFEAETLSDNRRMRTVFAKAGFAERESFDGSTIRVEMDIEPTAASLRATQERDRVSIVRSMDRLLRPRSVAVVGAGRSPGAIGHAIFATLLRDGFQGPVYPVNSRADHVGGVAAYHDVASVPGTVDLAVIAVPADEVLGVIHECGDKGVRGLVIVSAGFAETGGAGAALQREIVRAAHAYGMRIVGPNCMGIINTSPEISMNATFSPGSPVAGNVGFISQSGGLGIAIVAETARRGLGISTFVSMGNKADVSSNDLLRYWENDPETKIALLYLESFGNPSAFRHIAERFSRSKPIVALKAGRSEAGARATRSHTAALAGSNEAVNALFDVTGVIRVDRLEELFDMASYLATQPLPQGPRLAIIGNSGGPGALAADACEARGLTITPFSNETRRRLSAFLPDAASISNPVDMVASASAGSYAQAVRIICDDDDIDAVVVIFTPPLVTQADDVAKAIADVAATADKPVVAVFLATPGVVTALAGRVALFPFPESAADVLARALAYRRWKERPPSELAPPEGIDARRARAAVRDALASDRATDGVWLEPTPVATVLDAYGIAIPPWAVARTAHDAATAATAIGFPVALKAVAGLVHKTEAGATALGIDDRPALEAAYAAMSETLGDAMSGGLVQAMAGDGLQAIVGMVRDAHYGPLVMLGFGGTWTDLVGGHRFATAPLSVTAARELVESVWFHPLLTGYRHGPQLDAEALVDVIVRIGAMAADIPEIVELDLNPVVVHERGCTAVDVKVHVAPWMPSAEHAVRRLR